jgi:hypothetical protein
MRARRHTPSQSSYGQMFRRAYKEIQSKLYVYVRSATEVSTEEFSAYGEQCRQWAAEQGITVPDPERVA